MIINRLLALIITACITLTMLLYMVSCSTPTPEVPDDDDPLLTDDPNAGDTPETPVPDYKDYGRGTVDFDALSYSRPDLDALVSLLGSVESAIRENTLPYEEQLALMRSMNEPYFNYSSMKSMAHIYLMKDASNSFWATENRYMSILSPTISKAVDLVYIAAAESPHVEAFEEDYYGEGLYEDYYGKEADSEELVALYSEDARLTSEYESISEANLEFDINGFTGTCEEHIQKWAEEYGTSSIMYSYMVSLLPSFYEQARSNKMCDIYIEQLKVRRQIADLEGVESYVEIAYEDMGYDYTAGEMLELYSDIGVYVYAVYKELLHELYYYLAEFDTSSLRMPTNQLVSQLYNLYKRSDSDIADVYAYMLQHKLYDVSLPTSGRAGVSFATYIYDNTSPYLFVTANGYATDYFTMAHEFGHFYDKFVNYNKNYSLESQEVSSSALEYITLSLLEGSISEAKYKYLKYNMVLGVFDVLIYQSIFSTFEHLAYELEYDEITRENVDKLASEAAIHVIGEEIVELPFTVSNLNPIDNLNDVLVTHLIVAPMYVQSYVTSMIPALDIYFTEVENEGEGLALYKSYVSSIAGADSFVEGLTSLGIVSPFDDGAILEIANDIYMEIVGKRYFKINRAA